MQKQMLPILTLTTLGLFACTGEPQGPYESGLTVTREAEETRVSKSYLIYEDGNPKERKGTLNVGDDCETAGASSGKLTVTEINNYVDQFEVIGQTESSHPLIPGVATFGKAGVSVIAHTYLNDSDVTEQESFRVPGGAPSEWEETRTGETGVNTVVDYEGVAADEYVVQLNSLGDIWEDLEAEDSNINVNLMTRANAQSNDIWASLDGNTLFIAVGAEEVSVGGEAVSATKVEVYTVADVDPAASNVVETCVSIEKAEFETDHPDEENGTVRAAHLDPGCEQGYINQQIGTQWWYGNVLVKQEIVTYQVNVVDYGYEWYEVAGNNCFRETSITKDDRDAELFVEYVVTEITQTMSTSGWKVATE